MGRPNVNGGWSVYRVTSLPSGIDATVVEMGIAPLKDVVAIALQAGHATYVVFRW